MTEMVLNIGSSLSWEIEFADASLGEISGAAPTMRLSGPGGELTLTCLVLSGRERRVGAYATAVQTATLRPGYYRYEVRLHYPGGLVRASVGGTAQVFGGANA